MFEEEAEEYAKDSFRTFVKGIREIAKIAFQKGAEFGYNKALEEATHNYNAIIADYDKRIAELEAQIEQMKCCGNCKYFRFVNGAGYYTCIKDGKRNGEDYRSCGFNLEKWEGEKKKKMTKEELKNKYSAFITEISEILGLGKPIDVLKLCATTDLFFQPLEKHIEELEKENTELKAGRPKWHKVADGDLPKEHKIYLVAIKENGLAIAYFNGLHWETKYNLGDFGHCVETVIAWCEIPKFEEK